MRYKLTLSRKSPSCNLPIDYQSHLRAAIYQALAKVNPEYASFLHQTGYQHQGKGFKLFTFDQLDLSGGAKRLDKKHSRLICEANEVYLHVSFMFDKAADLFFDGALLKQILVIEDRHARNEFVVENMQEIDVPDVFEQNQDNPQQSWVFRAKTPIVVAQQNPKPERKGKTYLAPAHEMFKPIFLQNLEHRYKAYLQANQLPKPSGFSIKPNLDIIKVNRRKKITIKSGADVIGYTFDFRLTAPRQMAEVSFYGGFGSYSTYGFGYTDLLTYEKPRKR